MSIPDSQPDKSLGSLQQGGHAALADLFSQNRDRLRRMVQMRMDARMAGRVDASDVLQETFLDASRQLQGYLAEQPMSPFLWLRFLTGQRLMATHRRHLGTQKRDAKQEVALVGDWLPPANSQSLSQHVIGRLTTPSQAAVRRELQARVHKASLSCEATSLAARAIRSSGDMAPRSWFVRRRTETVPSAISRSPTTSI